MLHHDPKLLLLLLFVADSFSFTFLPLVFPPAEVRASLILCSHQQWHPMNRANCARCLLDLGPVDNIMPHQSSRGEGRLGCATLCHIKCCAHSNPRLLRCRHISGLDKHAHFNNIPLLFNLVSGSLHITTDKHLDWSYSVQNTPGSLSWPLLQGTSKNDDDSHCARGTLRQRQSGWSTNNHNCCPLEAPSLSAPLVQS